jgi:GNAT superfamily N-acetyltransferase
MPSDLQVVRRVLSSHPLFALYFEAAIDAMEKGEQNRSVLIGKSGQGVALSIDFSVITVRTTVGELTEDELAEAVAVDRPAELHLEPGHLAPAQRFLNRRIMHEKCLRYYRLNAPTGFALDSRCRLLTRSDERIVAAFYRDFYPATIFSPFMLDHPFMGLFDGDQLRSCAGVVVQSSVLGSANLGNFLTDPAWRGRGLAKAVARSLIGERERAEYRTFLLATTDDNIAARRVYQALGFHAFEERPQLTIP